MIIVMNRISTAEGEVADLEKGAAVIVEHVRAANSPHLLHATMTKERETGDYVFILAYADEESARAFHDEIREGADPDSDFVKFLAATAAGRTEKVLDVVG